MDQKNYFDNYKKLQDNKFEDIYADLIYEKMHTLELSNWIEFLKQ